LITITINLLKLTVPDDDITRVKNEFKKTSDKTKLAKNLGISRSYLYQITK
jgi:hypothetical protein